MCPSLVMTLTQFSQLNGLGYCVSRGCPMLFINSAYLILLSFTWVNIAQCFAANSRGKLSCLLHQWSMSKDAGKIFASWGTWWQIGSWLLSLIKKATATTSTTLCFLVKGWDYIDCYQINFLFVRQLVTYLPVDSRRFQNSSILNIRNENHLLKSVENLSLN